MSASHAAPDGFTSAMALVLALSAAGMAHVLWLKTRWARRLSQPLDGGATFRGRRVFGANKMLRGVVMMPLASSAAFALVGVCRAADPGWLAHRLWDLTIPAYAALGFACGLAAMLAELPNSFLKRQLDVEPSGVPRQKWLRPFCLVVDRSDATLGALTAVTLLQPVSAATWMWMLLLGPASHAALSAWMYHARLKARAL